MVLPGWLQEAAMSYIEMFKGLMCDEGANDDSQRKWMSPNEGLGAYGIPKARNIYDPCMKRLVYEIRIRSRFIYPDPWLDFARASWFRQLHQWPRVV